MNQTLKKVLFILFFILLYFATRACFYPTPLSGEEGMFAELIVNLPESPDTILSGRVDGKNTYNWPKHPLGIYSFLKTCGVMAQPYIMGVDWKDDIAITPRLRFIFSLFQFLLFMFLLLYIVLSRDWPAHPLLIVILTAVIVSPISISTSWELQVDGGVGVLMHGLLGLALLIALDKGLNVLRGFFIENPTPG